MKAYRGSRGTAPLILNLDRFTSGKELQSSLNRELGGLHKRYGCFWRRKVLAYGRIRIPEHPARSLFTVPTT